MPSRTKKLKPSAADTAVPAEEKPPEKIQPSKEQRENAAQCELDLIRLFLQHKKTEIACRRLENIIAQFHETDVAREAGRLLQQLQA